MAAAPPRSTTGTRTGPWRGFHAVLSHELRTLLFAPVTYLFLAGFLTLLSVCMFLVSDYFNGDEASISSLLRYLPWLSLLLVPAFAMRCWPQDQDDRSTELTLTLPIALPALVLGKFLAGWLLLCLTLAFTIALPATAFYLGEPDLGALLAGYLGAALMMAAYYALSMLGAAMVREPLGAFVVSVAILTALVLIGWDTTALALHGIVPAEVIAHLSLFSPARALDSIGRGLVELGSVGTFLAYTAGGLVACGGLLAVSRRHGGWADRRRLALVLAGTLAAVILLILGAARLPVSVDLTDEGEFSLDEGTREILSALPDGLTVTVYWSGSQSSVPTAIKAHARRVLGLLGAMAEDLEGRLGVRVVDPVPDTEAELAALRAGARRVPMSSGDFFYLGASVDDGTRTGRIPYFDLSRASLLEYDLALALEGLTQTRTPKVGLLSPLLPPVPAGETPAGLSFVAELRRNYDVAIIPFFTEEIPAELDALVLIDATVLKKRTLYAIDQYLMAGGSAIVLIDPYLRANPASNVASPTPSAEVDDISDLLIAYGLRYDGISVVGDASAAAQVRDEQQNPLAYPYWLRLRADSLAAGHSVTAGLNELLLAEPGAFTLEDGSPAEPLIRSGSASNAIDRNELDRTTPRERALSFEPDGEARILAAVRQGDFESAFAAPPEGAGEEHLTASRDAGLLFAVADVDWIFDAFALDSRTIGEEVVVRPLNDNLALLLNLVGYASGKDALISIRSRGRVNRTFTRVVQLFREAEAQLRQEEASLVRQVAELESNLRRAIQATADDPSAGSARPEDLQQFDQAQDALLAARRSLRDVRARIRRDVEDLGRTVQLVNILSGPALVLLLLAGVAGFRRIGRARGSEPR